jgi:hypothetical protein
VIASVDLDADEPTAILICCHSRAPGTAKRIEDHVTRIDRHLYMMPFVGAVTSRSLVRAWDDERLDLKGRHAAPSGAIQAACATGCFSGMILYCVCIRRRISLDCP